MPRTVPSASPAFQPSANVAELKESATIAVSTRAKALRAAGRSIIDLGAGEPDQPTPTYVMEAAHRALDGGATRYTPVEGITQLRERIASRASQLHRREISASQIVVSAGTKQALFNACFTLFGHGDEVLVPTPAWTSYYEILSLARASAVIVRGSATRSFKVTVEDLQRVCGPKTRGILINSPCNPTGAVYDERELASIAEFAESQGWWIVSDEIYRPIAYERAAPSMLSIVGSLDRLVICDGVAKGFAMPGWRIGWSISSTASARAMGALQSHVTSNATTISQHAALAALSNDAEEKSAQERILGDFRRRRDLAVKMLRAANVSYVEPDGAFYLFIHVGVTQASDDAPGARFAADLLEQQGVAVVPGTAFHAPEWIRLSYAAADNDVREGVRRLLVTLSEASGPLEGTQADPLLRSR